MITNTALLPQAVLARSRPPQVRALGLAILLLAGFGSHVARAQQAYSHYLNLNVPLTTNQNITSPSGKFFAVQQADGNLCVYAGQPGNAYGQVATNYGGVWCNGAGGRASGSYFTMPQGDGNLCTYIGSPSANKGNLWCSGSGGGTGNFFLALGDDSTLSVYSGIAPNSGTPVRRWSSPGWNATQIMDYYGRSGALKAVGSPTTFQTNPNLGSDVNFPSNRACPMTTYTVPDGITTVQITATGGAGEGANSANFFTMLSEMASVAGYTIPSSGPGTMSGGNGGQGATVSGLFTVSPRQVLYITPGMSGYQATYVGNGNGAKCGYPGGGCGFQPGGGLSFVATSKAPVKGDGNVCKVADISQLLVVAGGGGGGGLAQPFGSGGGGGNAGLLNGTAGGGQNGSGAGAGGGGGGGSPTAGGALGSGSGLRANGMFMQGSTMGDYGGAGGGGLWGGGGGGSSGMTGSGGGGGGSSYISPSAAVPTSSLDTTGIPGITIQPMTLK